MVKYRKGGIKVCDGEGCGKTTKLTYKNNLAYCENYLDNPDILYKCNGNNCRKRSKLNYKDSKLYCNLHLNNPNKKRVCNRIDCYEKNVIRIHRGLFCQKHKKELEDIRNNIFHDASFQDYFYHMKEYEIRKNICIRHLNHIYNDYPSHFRELYKSIHF